MIRKLALFALALFALLAVPLAADLFISFTVVSVTATDLVEIVIIGDGNGGLDAVISYRVLDADGNVYKERAVVMFPLSVDDKAKLNAFINTTVLPAVNAAEGLE